MIHGTLNVDTESIYGLFGITQNRGEELYDQIKNLTENAIHEDVANNVGFFDKNIYINNALQFAKTDKEVLYVVYHMGAFMEFLHQWVEHFKRQQIQENN